MKKHPTPILLLLCTALLIGGTAVAYCNTRSFGFEPDASGSPIMTGGFTVYDFRDRIPAVGRRLAKFFSNYFPKKKSNLFL